MNIIGIVFLLLGILFLLIPTIIATIKRDGMDTMDFSKLEE